MPGKHFEDIETGHVFHHALRGTVTKMDGTLFACLPHNTPLLHIDHEYAARGVWGRPLVHSMVTHGPLISASVEDATSGTLVAERQRQTMILRKTRAEA